MNRFGRCFGWVLAATLCCALAAVPVQATETKESASSKDAKEQAKESPLVKASREVESKKTGTAKTYGNDDLKESQTTGKVFTNDDLARMFGGSESREAPARAPDASAAPGTPEPAPDPLALMQQEQNARADRENEIAAAEAALAAAQQKLKSLEVQLLATRNPFSARPELSEEEQEVRATEQESAAERNLRTQKMVEEARAEVAEAEANLSRARSQ